MAPKCQASAATPWKSRAGNSRADIIIDPEGGNGRFNGQHIDTTGSPSPPPPAKTLRGRCFEAVPSPQPGQPPILPDRIWFFVEGDNHLYFGVINSDGDRIEGTRFRFSAAEAEDTQSGDDDWVATKT